MSRTKRTSCDCGNPLGKYRDRCDRCARIEGRVSWDFGNRTEKSHMTKYLDIFTAPSQGRQLGGQSMNRDCTQRP